MRGRRRRLDRAEALVVKFIALTKTQTALLCVALTRPRLSRLGMERNRMLRNRAAVAQSKLQAIHNQQDLSTADLE